MTDDQPPATPGFRDRWRASAVTFGPVGRIVASVVVVWPLWWLLRNAGPGIIGLPIYAFVLLPWALRDIWRRVPPAPRRPSVPPADGEVGPAEFDETTSILQRTPPQRW